MHTRGQQGNGGSRAVQEDLSARQISDFSTQPIPWVHPYSGYAYEGADTEGISRIFSWS